MTGRLSDRFADWHNARGKADSRITWVGRM
jgi:hypothetical protein